MRYVMKQKFISIGDDFQIFDENDTEVYFVDGYGMSLGKRFSFQDSHRNEILDVKQKLMSFTPTFRVYKSGMHIATIRKAFGALRNVFYLNFLQSHQKIKIVGKLVEHEYKFIKDGQTIVEVTKKWFRGTDTYSIDINGGKNHAVLLSAAVVVDLVCHDAESKHNR